MIIHPELRALRGNDAPQRAAQDQLYAAMAGWRSRPYVRDVLADLTTFAGHQPQASSPSLPLPTLASCPALARLFDSADPAAERLTNSFVQCQAQALASAPLGHLALRHFTDGTISTLLLGRAGHVTLTLVAIDGPAFTARTAPVSACFAPVESWERILSGSARADLVSRRPLGSREDGLDRQRVSLEADSVVHRLGQSQTLQLLEVDGRIVSLRLQRRDPDAGPAVEIDLASGKQLHQAAGNPRDSRLELMLALLGRMGRADTAPAMAELALGKGSAPLRWQAMRECLALDTQTGFAALSAVAHDHNDSLQSPAAALRMQLVTAHPQLERIEPCPA